MTAADVVLAIAAIVQACTAVAIWRLTKRLATATETYAEQTKLMVDEMSEQRKHQETADIRAASERVVRALNNFQGVLNRLHSVESEVDATLGVDKSTLSEDQLKSRQGTVNAAAGLRLLEAAYDFTASFSDEFGAFDLELFERGMLLSRIIRGASLELRSGRLDIDGSIRSLTLAQAILVADFGFLRQHAVAPTQSRLPDEPDIVGWLHQHRDDSSPPSNG